MLIASYSTLIWEWSFVWRLFSDVFQSVLKLNSNCLNLVQCQNRFDLSNFESYIEREGMFLPVPFLLNYSIPLIVSQWLWRTRGFQPKLRDLRWSIIFFSISLIACHWSVHLTWWNNKVRENKMGILVLFILTVIFWFQNRFWICSLILVHQASVLLMQCCFSFVCLN